MFGNDPDVFLLRDDNMRMSFARRTALTKVNALFGSLLMTSDKISDYDEEKRAVLEDALAIFRRAKRCGLRNKGRSAVVAFELDGAQRFLSYDYRKGTITEMNDAQLTLTQASLQQSQAVYNFIVAKSNLEKTLGYDFIDDEGNVDLDNM